MGTMLNAFEKSNSIRSTLLEEKTFLIMHSES